MPQNLKRFEQRGLQHAALPGRFFDYRVKESALFARWLLKEQLARPACQPHHIDGLIHRGWCRRLNILDLAQQVALLGTHRLGALIKGLLADPPVEFVRVHCLDPSFKLVVSDFESRDNISASGLLSPVGVQNLIAKPIEDRPWDDQFLEYVGEFTRQKFLPHIALVAFPAIASAMVVNVLAFLRFTDEETSAMPAPDDPSKGKVVLHLSSFGFGSRAQHALHSLPAFASYKRFVGAPVGFSVPIKITRIQTFPEYLMSDT